MMAKKSDAIKVIITILVTVIVMVALPKESYAAVTNDSVTESVNSVIADTEDADTAEVSASASAVKTEDASDSSAAEAEEEPAAQPSLREQVINYALSFVGGPYRYGGTDPHTGVDCSGFTSYIMKAVAGINLSHSSSAQASQGKAVSTPKPGDLVFYASGGKINHVAIYMGDNKVVHASTEKTGIKVSDLYHRTPVKIVDVLS